MAGQLSFLLFAFSLRCRYAVVFGMPSILRASTLKRSLLVSKCALVFEENLETRNADFRKDDLLWFQTLACHFLVTQAESNIPLSCILFTERSTLTEAEKCARFIPALVIRLIGSYLDAGRNLTKTDDWLTSKN